MAEGFLTTHVLDTAQGIPAAGLRVELFRVNNDGVKRLNDMRTNEDGRTDAPILPQEHFAKGTYELRFHAGEYLRRAGVSDDPLFLDVVPIRFGMSEDDHYHVPLLLSPFGYSTYRGS